LDISGPAPVNTTNIGPCGHHLCSCRRLWAKWSDWHPVSSITCLQSNSRVVTTLESTIDSSGFSSL